MALLLVESFDWLDISLTGPQLDTHLGNRKGRGDSFDFTTGDDATTVAGIGGNGAALSFAETSHTIRLPLSKTTASTAEVGMGFWFRGLVPTGWLAETQWFGLVDSGGAQLHINARMHASGTISVYLGGTFIETITDFIFEPNQWYWVEYKTVINDSTGSYEFRVDGTTIWTVTGVDTRNSGNGDFSALEIHGLLNGANRTQYAGCIAWDDDGGDLTDYPGPTTFKSLHPDADGDDEAWTTSSGTDSFALVNETAPHDDDSDYIEDTVSTNRTLFTYDDLSTNYTAVHGLQINSVARETDASDFTLINALKSGGINYPEAAQAIAGTAFESLFNIRDTDPDTAVAWTIANLNALQAGVEVG